MFARVFAYAQLLKKTHQALCRKESDGSWGEGRAFGAVYWSKPARGPGAQHTIEKGKEMQGSQGPQPCLHQQFFSLCWQAAHSRSGMGEIPLLPFPVEFNNPLKVFLWRGEKISMLLSHREREREREREKESTAVRPSLQISKFSRDSTLIYRLGDLVKLSERNLGPNQWFISVIYHLDF